MRSDRQIRVGVLYPDLLNIYADRGNLIFLRRRSELRGLQFSLVPISIGDRLDPDSIEMVYIGGGQDRDQNLCAEDLALHQAAALRACHAQSMPILAVCGGYQLLGSGYETEHGMMPGAGLLDLTTVRAEGPRLVGPCAVRTDLGGPTDGVVAGFENHAGRTELGASSIAFGTVISGHGNNGVDGLEGCRDGRLIGTYLHGPLLPKNWWLADWFLAAALDCEPSELSELNDRLERAAHAEALGAAGL